MQSTKLIGLEIGTCLIAGMTAGVGMHLIGYELFAVGAGILTTCMVSFAVGYFGNLRQS